MYSDSIYTWLETALDWGITEYDFWNMTFAELNRLLDSKRRTQKQQAQEKAYYNYVLADLIGKSVGRLYNSANKFPEIYSVYPDLFDKEIAEEQRAKRQDELSALRFKQFADTFNKRFEGGKQ